MRFCLHCHKPETLIEFPDACVCDKATWLDKWNPRNPINSICDEYQGDGDQNCRRCEHDEGCHKTKGMK